MIVANGCFFVLQTLQRCCAGLWYLYMPCKCVFKQTKNRNEKHLKPCQMTMSRRR